MHRTPALFFAATRCNRLNSTARTLKSSDAIISIRNATFYRQHPESMPSQPQIRANDIVPRTAPNPPLFPNLTINLPAFPTPNQHWAILSPSSTIRTAFLQVLRGQYICLPPTARSYPYLSSEEIAKKNPKLRFPERAIEYVGFDVERSSFGGAYLSARYESRVEETDFTLRQYLTGIVSMNPGEEMVKEMTPEKGLMEKVVRDLELERFLEKPVSMLSNGQSRRARIGKSLLRGPEMLCLDAPFMGLDPFVSRHISEVLKRLAEGNAPRIVLSLRPQDGIPEWVTHVVYAGEDGKVEALGPKKEVFVYLRKEYEGIESRVVSRTGDLEPRLVELREVGKHLSERGDFDTTELDEISDSGAPVLSRDGYSKIDPSSPHVGEPLVEMEGVRIAYGSNSVLGDWQQDINGTQKPGLWWTIHRGQRWGIFGANGSGKTTLLSLVTSDHPQTYSAPVKLFQRSRLPSPGIPGITIFDIQSRMGHSSPEVHALFPKYLSIRKALESAWSDTPITKPRLTPDASKRVDACLRWFEAELNPLHQEGNITQNVEWATKTNFAEVSFSSQRIILFLRSTIRHPDIVILDEAFSGMDDLVRDKCLLFLSRGETMKLHYTETGPKLVQSEVQKRGEVVVEGLQDHQGLLCVSHSRQEIPGCVREWICLPDQGMGKPRFGRWEGPVELSAARWGEVWGEERRS